jgi:predicted amidohydrolase
LTIALAQIDCVLGSLQPNLDTHIELIRQARTSGAQVVLFPELSLTGYCLQDLVPSVALSPHARQPVFETLCRESREIDVLVGFVEADVRGLFYIASAYLSAGEIVHIHRKVYLPTYGLFDEGRFFAAGQRVRAFDTQYGRVGMLICEDFWHASPPYLLWLDGADILYLMSASPGRGLTERPQLASAEWVERINQAYASLLTVFVAHANRTGFEDGLGFWGGSTVFGPAGTLLAQGPYSQQALTLAVVDLDEIRRTRARLPLLRDEKPDLTLRELERITVRRSHQSLP